MSTIAQTSTVVMDSQSAIGGGDIVADSPNAADSGSLRSYLWRLYSLSEE